MNAAQRRCALRAIRRAYPMGSVWHFTYASIYTFLARAGHPNVRIVAHRSLTKALVESSPCQPEGTPQPVKLRHLRASRQDIQLESVSSA